MIFLYSLEMTIKGEKHKINISKNNKEYILLITKPKKHDFKHELTVSKDDMLKISTVFNTSCILFLVKTAIEEIEKI